MVLFPGSFDPFTEGHLDILTRALKAHGEVTVAVAVNPDKTPHMPLEQRLEIIRKATSGMKGVTVTHYEGQTAEWCRRNGVRTIIRGYRSAEDLDYEKFLASVYKQQWDEIEVDFLPASDVLKDVSSTAVRSKLGIE